MPSENRKVFGGDSSGDGDGESHSCQLVDPPEVFWFPGEVSGGLAVTGTLDDDVLDAECAPSAGTLGVVPLVGELDLHFTAELPGHFAYLVDGCQGCSGDTGDEVGACFKAHSGDLGPGFGNANVSKNCLVRVGSPDSPHRIHSLSKDEDGTALDDVDLVDGGGQRSQGRRQIIGVKSDLKSWHRRHPASGSKPKKVAALLMRRSLT